MSSPTVVLGSQTDPQSIDAPIAYAWLPGALAVPGTAVAVEYFGERLPRNQTHAAFCDTGTSYGSPQYSHPYAYLTPDNRRVIFNSDRTRLA